MARPYRCEPPEAHGELVLRAEAQRRLAGRFDRRITVLSAGAGFGKTTALAQADRENRLSPRGVDRWLACEPGDRDADTLATGLLAMMRAGDDGPTDASADPTPPDEALGRVVEAVLAAGPEQVCLVLDDVHHVPAGSAGAELLALLVDTLPANGHLVLSGRTAPPVPLARLQALGRCEVIDEPLLRLDDDAVADLLRRSPDAITDDVARLAGWPALVALAQRGGRPDAFVGEEVLDRLDTFQRALLIALVAVGEADERLLVDVAGIDPTRAGTGNALDAIPLVQRRGTRYVAHDLWREHLGARSEVHAARDLAIDVLRRRGDAERAVEVALGGASAERLEAALRSALISLSPPPGDVLRRWARVLPVGDSSSPERLLLDGLVGRLDDPAGDDTHRSLAAAAEAFRDRGDDGGEVGALGALAFAQHVRRDGAALFGTFGRLGELADAGMSSALPYRALGRAIVATSMHDPHATIAEITPLIDRPLPRELRAVALWLLANARNNVGESSVEISDECVSLGVPLPGLSMATVSARWRAGMIGSLLEGAPIDPSGRREQFLGSVWAAIVAAGTGDDAGASHHLETMRATAEPDPGWQTVLTTTITEATVLAERGETAAAAEQVRALLADHPPGGPADGYYVNGLTLVYTLVPEVRGHFDERTDLGPLFRRDLALNQALVAAVERDDPTPATHVALPDHAGELIPALGCRRAAQLLAVCWSVRHDEVTTLVDEFQDLLGESARHAFRSASAHPRATIARGARSIVESAPIPPAAPLMLRLFGGTSLEIDGVVVESPDWRRERVRALMTLLVLHPDTTRDATIDALWPDADRSSGRRNLRSTLNVLNSVLEPRRHGGDAPFFVRSNGQGLRLVTGAHLDVDVGRFEDALGRARRAERNGTPSLSIEPYQEAIRWYRGDLLPDAYDDWVLFERDRLRSAYVGAAVRCGELLTGVGRTTEAIDTVIAVLAAEPWSEPAHRTLIAAYLAQDDIASARRALQRCRLALEPIGGIADDRTRALERRLSPPPTTDPTTGQVGRGAV